MHHTGQHLAEIKLQLELAYDSLRAAKTSAPVAELQALTDAQLHIIGALALVTRSMTGAAEAA